MQGILGPPRLQLAVVLAITLALLACGTTAEESRDTSPASGSGKEAQSAGGIAASEDAAAGKTYLEQTVERNHQANLLYRPVSLAGYKIHTLAFGNKMSLDCNIGDDISLLNGKRLPRERALPDCSFNAGWESPAIISGFSHDGKDYTIISLSQGYLDLCGLPESAWSPDTDSLAYLPHDEEAVKCATHNPKVYTYYSPVSCNPDENKNGLKPCLFSFQLVPDK